MKRLAAIICLALASCATVPRAIIPPPAVIAELDVAPVAEAGEATGAAVRDVAAAGSASREAGRKVSDTTRRLSDSLAKAEAIAVADKTKLEDLATENSRLRSVIGDMRGIIADLEREAMDLTAAHTFAEEKERVALQTITSLDDEMALLKANAKAQAVELRHAAATEATLREQVEALAANADKRLIAEEKLRWWRKAAGLTWAFLAVYLTVKFFGAAIAANLRLR